jgi:hypothetical protein
MKEERNPNRILDKLDAMDAKLHSIDKTLVKQEENLAEHMRRTKLLEDKLQPVEDHVKYMHGALKLLIVVSIVFGIMKAVM